MKHSIFALVLRIILAIIFGLLVILAFNAQSKVLFVILIAEALVTLRCLVKLSGKK